MGTVKEDQKLEDDDYPLHFSVNNSMDEKDNDKDNKDDKDKSKETKKQTEKVIDRKLLETDPATISAAACGHAVLTYKASGGKLLTSMTHWSELTKMSVGGDQFFKVAAATFGEERCEVMRAEMDTLQSIEAKAQWLSAQSNMFVQQAAPACSKTKKQKIMSKMNVW